MLIYPSVIYFKDITPSMAGTKIKKSSLLLMA
jgi:hypothetical protein